MNRSSRYALAYLGLLGLALVVVLVEPLRSRALGAVESTFMASERAWISQVEEGEALVEQGLFADAVPYLRDLDERFPANTNIHALDKERERLLHALGAAHEGLGQKGRALDAYRRAVAFDPRNIENHYALAEAALRLDEAGEAEEHLDHALQIWPAHAGAARDRIALLSEGGDFAGVRSTFETYLNAFVSVDLMVSMGDWSTVVQLRRDGTPSRARVGLIGATEAGVVTIEGGGASVDVLEVRWFGRPVAGVEGRSWGIASRNSDGTYVIPAPVPGEIHISARSTIPVEAGTFREVETAYRNLLASDDFAALAPRLEIVETVR